MMTRLALRQIVERLKTQYGVQKPPKRSEAWGMILWENVAYLADDERRKRAFDLLKKQIGTKPERILDASDDALQSVTGHGILAETFSTKLRQCAKIMLEQFDGDLDEVIKRPLPEAKKALGKFPGIGEPGAEKILLFTRSHPVLPLESNGLRVLVRIGFAEEQKSYSKTYQLVQRAIAPDLKKHYVWLMQTHILLRRHGQELCKRSKPKCEDCPLVRECEYGRKAEV